MHREEYGFGYLFSVGIPSAWDLSWFGHGHEDEYIGFVTYKKHSLKWFEVNASRRGHDHFEGLYESWDYTKYPIENPR